MIEEIEKMSPFYQSLIGGLIAALLLIVVGFISQRSVVTYRKFLESAKKAKMRKDERITSTYLDERYRDIFIQRSFMYAFWIFIQSFGIFIITMMTLNTTLFNAVVGNSSFFDAIIRLFSTLYLSVAAGMIVGAIKIITTSISILDDWSFALEEEIAASIQNSAPEK